MLIRYVLSAGRGVVIASYRGHTYVCHPLDLPYAMAVLIAKARTAVNS